MIAVTSNNKFWSVDVKISTSMNSLELGKASCDTAAMVLQFIITGRNNDSIAIALSYIKSFDDDFVLVRKVTGMGRN